MIRSMRRRSDRPGQARRRPIRGVEALEARQLLASNAAPGLYQPYYFIHPVLGTSTPGISVAHPIGTATPAQLNALNQPSRLITGKDRLGDEYIITVHGPGSVIVTDTTPNDGVLDDDIDTIQILNSTSKTLVAGQVTGSARVTTTGTIPFNHLIALDPVGHIQLNGFTLARTTSPPTAVTDPNAGVTAQPSVIPQPEIYLPGGVKYLSFHNIDAQIDTATGANPFNIVIGNPTTPTTSNPTIHLDSIFNSVINSDVTSNPPTIAAQTTPTVNVVVNGNLHDLSYVSSGSPPLTTAGYSFEFPAVNVTGRTAIQARGVDHLRVVGSAKNTTVSRSPQPFQHGFSGVDHLGTAEFGGTADAVGLDVNGTLGHLRLLRGGGNPAGTGTSAADYGLPAPQKGYPGNGYEGLQVSARKIGRVTVGAANLIRQTPADPDLIQARRQGSTVYYTRPGTALANATITSDGSIGRTTIVGVTQTSTIQSGFNNSSYIAGLEPVRAPSAIGKVRQRGDAVDSVVAATYRTGSTNAFGVAPGSATTTNVAGPGKITGKLSGNLYSAGQKTPLQTTGVGFFARKKVGYLPPPETSPTNANGIITRS